MMPSHANRNDKSKLIDKCDAIYVWHKDAIFRLALDAVGGDKDWALELLEECMMAAYRNIDKFGDEKSAETKSVMVAILQSNVNKIYSDVWKKLGTDGKKDDWRRAAFSKKERADVDQVLIRNELTAELAKYVERLTNAEKEFAFLRYFAGFSGEEISAHFGATPDEIEKMTFALKQKIAKMMMER